MMKWEIVNMKMSILKNKNNNNERPWGWGVGGLLVFKLLKRPANIKNIKDRSIAFFLFKVSHLDSDRRRAIQIIPHCVP